MSKRNSMVSESIKAEAANELGLADVVKKKGWGEVSSKDCGNIVKKALEISERNSKQFMN